MSLRLVIGTLVISSTLAFGCKKDEPNYAEKVTPEAETVFKTRCAACHGEDGKATGPAAAAMNPKPRDLTDSAWQASVTDEALTTVIGKGGAAAGKSSSMPPNPDLEGKPVLSAVVAKVRTLKAK